MKLLRFSSTLAGTFLLLGLSGRALAQDWIYPMLEGDNFWNLCLEYTNKPGCWQELGKYNGVERDREIPIGTEIRIPVAWLTDVPVVAEVSALSGTVDYDQRSDGGSVTITRGQSLALGSTIRVRQGSATIRLINGNEMVLRAGAELTFDAMSTRKNVKGVSELELNRGEVEIDVAPSSNSRFEIRTPSAIAAVRGTRYRLAAEEATRGEVLEGAVSVEAGSTTVVEGGYGVLARKGEPVSEPRKLLPAPVLKERAEAGPLPYLLEWNTHPGAQRWRLDLFAEAQSDALIATHDVSQPSFTFENIALGCYRVQLQGIDAEGFNGMPSQKRLCVEAAPPPETPNHWKAFVTSAALMLLIL